MTKFRSSTLLVVPALALTLAACGGGKSDSDKIGDIVKDVNAHPSAYCDHAAKAPLAAIGGKDACVTASKAGKPDTTTKLGKISVDGDKATAQFTDSQGAQKVSFVKESGDWKIVR